MPISVPNLDDRSFDDLYREVIARVPVHTPEWTNLDDSDPGSVGRRSDAAQRAVNGAKACIKAGELARAGLR